MSNNQGSVSFDYLFKSNFLKPSQREIIKKGSLASLFSFGKKETNSLPTTQNAYTTSFSKDTKTIRIKTASATQPTQIKIHQEKQIIDKQTPKRLQIEVKAESLLEKPKTVQSTIVVKNERRTVGKKSIANAFCGFDQEQEEVVEATKKKIKVESRVEKESKQVTIKEYIANNKVRISEKDNKKMEEEKHNEIEGKQRIESLIKSMSDLIADSEAQDTPAKIRKKPLNPLIKFLLSSRYHEQKPSLITTTCIDNEFDNYEDYQKAFQPLMLNEYLSSVHASIKSSINEKTDSKIVSYKIAIDNDDQTEEDGFISLDLKRASQHGKTSPAGFKFQMSETTDFSDANNYLVLISSSRDVRLDLVNNSQPDGRFAIVGYLTSDSKLGSEDFQRISIAKQFITPKILQQDWTFCYIRLIDKVTTFVREYNSLSSLSFAEASQYHFRPRNMLTQFSTENTLFYQKFFDNQKLSYNDCQLKVMKNICSSTKKINLLQGPPGTGKTHTLIGLVSAIFHSIKAYQKTPKQKRYIMICAPSNAAIDEIIQRILVFGIENENGEPIVPNVIKVGVLDRDSPELVKKHTLENLAQEKIQQAKMESLSKEENLGNQLKTEMERISQQLEDLKKSPNKNGPLIKTLEEDKKTLEEQYQKFCKHCAPEKNYKQILQNILRSADIICCTLTSAGSEKLSSMKGYIEALIVDEASQCTEPSNIIPFQYSPKKIILIGDPRQLPPTTFCANANTTKFNRSLFERIIDCGIQPEFLCEQYRMVPSIRQFPSMRFYEDRLTDSIFIQNRNFPSYLQDFERQNVLFLDLKFSQEKEIEHSFCNDCEIEACVQIIGVLLQKLKQCVRKYKNGIGCISPYKRQVNILNEKLREKYGDSYKEYIVANTVDAFQGQEKDIIVLSTVRANPKIYTGFDEQNFIGFLSDMRRLNVAITRPKYALIVIGNSNTLATNATWRSYINHLVQNKSYFSIPQATKVDEIVQLILKNENIPAHLTEPPGTLKKTPPKYSRPWENRNEINSADSVSTRDNSQNVSPISPFKSTPPPPQKDFAIQFGYGTNGASWMPTMKPPPPASLDFNFKTNQNESLTARKNVRERLEPEVIFENKAPFAKSSRFLFPENKDYHSTTNHFEQKKIGLIFQTTQEKVKSEYLESSINNNFLASNS